MSPASTDRYRRRGRTTMRTESSSGLRQRHCRSQAVSNRVRRYAFAAGQPGRVTKFAILDGPVPGVGPWDEILKNPLLWHFRFGGPDMERLVKGRERIYLDRFWNEFSGDPKRLHEASRL